MFQKWMLKRMIDKHVSKSFDDLKEIEVNNNKNLSLSSNESSEIIQFS